LLSGKRLLGAGSSKPASTVKRAGRKVTWSLHELDVLSGKTSELEEGCRELAVVNTLILLQV
jgi:hypothetical protein